MLVSKTVCEISRKGITNLRPGMDWPEKKGSAPTEDPTIRASAFYKDKSKTLIRASAIPATKRRGNKKPEWANKSFIECEQKTVKYITRDVLLYVLYHNGYVSADVLNGYEAF